MLEFWREMVVAVQDSGMYRIVSNLINRFSQEGNMRKQLLATTAMAVAGAFALSQSAVAMEAGKMSVKVSGQFEQGIGFNENSGDIVNQQDSEVHVTASIKLDNGLTISGKTEFEADADALRASDGGPPDESFVSVSGAFGQLQLGSADGASYEKTGGYLGTWGANTGMLNPDFDNGAYLLGDGYAPAIRGVHALPRMANDAALIAYYTPRTSGLQFGVSYAQGAGTNGSTSDNMETSLTYVGSFGDASVGVGVGYTMGNSDAGENPETTLVGVKAGFGGITVAGSFLNVVRPTFGEGDDLDRFDLGLRYAMGPMTVSVGFMSVEDGSGNDTSTSKASLSYTLGPGVVWGADLMIGDHTNADGTAGDGLGLHTGFLVKF